MDPKAAPNPADIDERDKNDDLEEDDRDSLGGEAQQLLDLLAKTKAEKPKEETARDLPANRAGFGTRVPDADLLADKPWAAFLPGSAPDHERFEGMYKCATPDSQAGIGRKADLKDMFKTNTDGDLPQWLYEDGSIKFAINEYCNAKTDLDRQASIRLLEKEALAGTPYALDALKGLQLFDAATRLADSAARLKAARASGDTSLEFAAIREQQSALRDMAAMESTYDTAKQFLERYPSGDDAMVAFQRKQIDYARKAVERETTRTTTATDASIDAFLKATTPADRKAALQKLEENATKLLAGLPSDSGHASMPALVWARAQDAAQDVAESSSDPETLAKALLKLKAVSHMTAGHGIENPASNLAFKLEQAAGVSIDALVTRLADPTKRVETMALLKPLLSETANASRDQVRDMATFREYKKPSATDFLTKFPDKTQVEDARLEVEAYAKENFERADTALADYLRRIPGETPEDKVARREKAIAELETERDERFSAFKRDHFGSTLDWMKNTHNVATIRETDDPFKAAEYLQKLIDDRANGGITANMMLQELLLSQKSLNLIEPGENGEFASILKQLQSEDKAERENALGRLQNLLPDTEAPMNEYRVRRLLRHVDAKSTAQDWARVNEQLKEEVEAKNPIAADWIRWSRPQEAVAKFAEATSPAEAETVVKELTKAAVDGNEHARNSLSTLLLSLSGEDAVLDLFENSDLKLNGKLTFVPNLDKLRENLTPSQIDKLKDTIVVEFAEAVEKSGRQINHAEAHSLALALRQSHAENKPEIAEKITQLLRKCLQKGGEGSTAVVDALAAVISANGPGAEKVVDLFLEARYHPRFADNCASLRFSCSHGGEAATHVYAALAAGVGNNKELTHLAQKYLTESAGTLYREKTLGILTAAAGKYGDSAVLMETIGHIAGNTPALTEKTLTEIEKLVKQAPSVDALRASLLKLPSESLVDQAVIDAACKAKQAGIVEGDKLKDALRDAKAQIPDDARWLLQDGLVRMTPQARTEVLNAFAQCRTAKELEEKLATIKDGTKPLSLISIQSVVDQFQKQQQVAALNDALANGAATDKQSLLKLAQKHPLITENDVDLVLKTRDLAKDPQRSQKFIEAMLKQQDDNRYLGTVKGMMQTAQHWKIEDVSALTRHVTKDIADALPTVVDRIPPHVHKEMFRQMELRLAILPELTPANRAAVLDEQLQIIKSVGTLSKFASKDTVANLSLFVDPEKALKITLTEQEKKDFDREASLSLCRIIGKADDDKVRDLSIEAFCNLSWKELDLKSLREPLAAYAKGHPERLDLNDKALKLVYDTGLKRPLAGVFRDMGMAGTDAELIARAEEAIKFYGKDGKNGEQVIRDILARAELYNALEPTTMKTRISGSDAPVDKLQVVAQIMNKSLGDKACCNSFLMEPIEEKIAALRQNSLDKAKESESKLKKLEEERIDTARELAKLTRKGVGFLDRIDPFDNTVDHFEMDQNYLVGKIRGKEAAAATVKKELGNQQGVASILGMNQQSYEHSKLIMSGALREADTLAVGMLSRSNLDELKQFAPGIHAELIRQGERPIDFNALQRLHRNGMAESDTLPIYNMERPEGRPPFTSAESVKDALHDLATRKYARDKVDSAPALEMAMRAVDGEYSVGQLASASEVFLKHQPILMEMFRTTGGKDARGEHGNVMSGTRFDKLVNDLRSRVGDMEAQIRLMNRKEIGDPPKSRLELLNEHIAAMREAARNATSDDAKRMLQERIQRLENGAKMFTPGTQEYNKMAQLFDMVKSEKFDSSTFMNWLKNEGPVILAAIGAAVLVIALLPTGAGGVVAGLLIAPLAAALAGDATSWAMGHHSIMGDYFKGKPVIDKDGNAREREFGKDVLKPFGKQYLKDLAICIGTLGVGRVLGPVLGKTTAAMGNAARWSADKALGLFIKENAGTLAKAAAKIQQAELVAARAGKAGFGQKYMTEFMSNVKFVGQVEVGSAVMGSEARRLAGENLSKGNQWLGIAATALVCTLHGAKGARMRPEEGVLKIEAGEMPMADVMRQFHVDGFQIMEATGKTFKIKTPEGGIVEVVDTRPSAGKAGMPDIAQITGRPLEKPVTEAAPVKPGDTAIVGKPTAAPVEPPRVMDPAVQKESNRYSIDHRVTGELPNGFTNGGAGRYVSNDGTTQSPRATVYADRVSDPVLRDTIAEARDHMKQFEHLSPAEQMVELTRFVQDKFSPAEMTAVAPGMSPGKMYDSAYIKFMMDNKGTSVPLGRMIDMKLGGCAEQTMLLKILAHDLKLPAGAEITMVRGNGTNAGNKINHAWLEIKLPGEKEARIYDPRQGVFGEPVSNLKERYKPGSEMPKEVKKGIDAEAAKDLKFGDKVTVEGDSGWKVKSEMSDGTVLLTHDAVRTVPQAERASFLEANPHLKDAAPDLTKPVKMNGQEGWKIVGIDKQTGSYVLYKPDAVQVKVNKDQVQRAIPELTAGPVDIITNAYKDVLAKTNIPAEVQTELTTSFRDLVQSGKLNQTDLQKHSEALKKVAESPDILAALEGSNGQTVRARLNELAKDPKLVERVTAFETLQKSVPADLPGLKPSLELMLDPAMTPSRLAEYQKLLNDPVFKAEAASLLKSQYGPEFRAALENVARQSDFAVRAKDLVEAARLKQAHPDSPISMRTLLDLRLDRAIASDYLQLGKDFEALKSGKLKHVDAAELTKIEGHLRQRIEVMNKLGMGENRLSLPTSEHARMNLRDMCEVMEMLRTNDGTSPGKTLQPDAVKATNKLLDVTVDHCFPVAFKHVLDPRSTSGAARDHYVRMVEQYAPIKHPGSAEGGHAYEYQMVREAAFALKGDGLATNAPGKGKDPWVLVGSEHGSPADGLKIDGALLNLRTGELVFIDIGKSAFTMNEKAVSEGGAWPIFIDHANAYATKREGGRTVTDEPTRNTFVSLGDANIRGQIERFINGNLTHTEGYPAYTYRDGRPLPPNQSFTAPRPPRYQASDFALPGERTRGKIPMPSFDNIMSAADRARKGRPATAHDELYWLEGEYRRQAGTLPPDLQGWSNKAFGNLGARTVEVAVLKTAQPAVRDAVEMRSVGMGDAVPTLSGKELGRVETGERKIDGRDVKYVEYTLDAPFTTNSSPMHRMDSTITGMRVYENGHVEIVSHYFDRRGTQVDRAITIGHIGGVFEGAAALGPSRSLSDGKRMRQDGRKAGETFDPAKFIADWNAIQAAPPGDKGQQQRAKAKLLEANPSVQILFKALQSPKLIEKAATDGASRNADLATKLGVQPDAIKAAIGEPSTAPDYQSRHGKLTDCAELALKMGFEPKDVTGIMSKPAEVAKLHTDLTTIKPLHDALGAGDLHSIRECLHDANPRGGTAELANFAANVNPRPTNKAEWQAALKKYCLEKQAGTTGKVAEAYEYATFVLP